MKLHLHVTVFILLGLLILPGCGQKQGESESGWPPVSHVTKPWSRWWWLGSDVDRANIEQLMASYAASGLGGMEITPIYGVKGRESQTIDYLSPEWMDMLDACIAAAGEHGMAIDMNLGTGWPFGGPQITTEAAAGKLIIQPYEITVPGPLPGRIVPTDPLQVRLGASLEALMAWHEDGTMLNLTDRVSQGGMLEWDPKPGRWQLLAAFCGKTGQQVKRAAPGGKGLTMDHFSREALEVYLARFDSAFTPERGHPPQEQGAAPEAGPDWVRCFFNDSYEVYGASWTPGFFSAFEEKRGIYFLLLIILTIKVVEWLLASMKATKIKKE